MIQAASLLADASWLPHRIDVSARRVLFLRLDRRELSEPGFLAEREHTAAQVWLSLDNYVQAVSSVRPLHFIFHSGFCRSTLLARALDIPAVAVTLNEPGILNSLVRIGGAGASLLKPTLAWLSRPHISGEAVVVKPSNYVNVLIEPILRASPGSKAILMTNPLTAFLHRVARKGFMGRLWGRQVFLETHALPGNSLGLDMGAVAAMTDLQVSGLAWFLYQQNFLGLLTGEHQARLRTLHGERFNTSRTETLLKISELFAFGLTRSEARAIADGAVFKVHAKGGGDFEQTETRAMERGASPAVSDEIAHVEQWIGKLAKQAGQQMPVAQSLF